MTRYKGRQSAKAKTLSANRLRKLVNYAPATGVFRWRVHRRGPKNVDGVAGSIRLPKGYRQIRVDGKMYRANRLAWLYMTGKWPKLEIGYINGLARALFEELRARLPGRPAMLFVRADNAASLRAHQKMGMHDRGTFTNDGVSYIALTYSG